jgi:hypothetical protein
LNWILSSWFEGKIKKYLSFFLGYWDERKRERRRRGMK